MFTPNDATTDATSTGFDTVLTLIAQGPWQLLQLRGAPFGPAAVNAGDVDFLVSDESLERLLAALFAWTRQGNGHLWIHARDETKTGVALVSRDGRRVLRLDLWRTLYQIDGRAAGLTFARCETLVSATGSSIVRLPAGLEFCIYVHHLVAKRRKLERPAVVERMAGYRGACAAAGHADLVDVIDRIVGAGKIDGAAIGAVNRYMRDAGLDPATLPRRRTRDKAMVELRAALLDGPHPAKFVSITGCDGSGKTTLARNIAHSDPQVRGMMVGKRLYRNSIVYRLLTEIIRPLTGGDGNKVDEWLTPLTYPRAALGLRLRSLVTRRGPLYLVDRSLTDFLVVKRKTDAPRLHKAAWLARFAGLRIPVIHLVVPAAILQERKQEMTPIGQHHYDNLMFRELSRRAPTSYAVFFNGGDPASAAAGLTALLALMSRANPAAPSHDA